MLRLRCYRRTIVIDSGSVYLPDEYRYSFYQWIYTITIDSVYQIDIVLSASACYYCTQFVD